MFKCSFVSINSPVMSSFRSSPFNCSNHTWSLLETPFYLFLNRFIHSCRPTPILLRRFGIFPWLPSHNCLISLFTWFFLVPPCFKPKMHFDNLCSFWLVYMSSRQWSKNECDRCLIEKFKKAKHYVEFATPLSNLSRILFFGKFPLFHVNQGLVYPKSYNW